MAVGLGVGLGIFFSLIAGLIIGWYLAMRVFKKQLRENPPITEKQIRQMYMQMGRKPSEKQIKQIMNQFKKQS
ncbi:YneF family protein [Mycoplasmoides fastidiosum]|uniref:YneF family protein n=1 Tax=Mycoplasmoides fastidiosum TaxID=92758 RepID=UPI002113DCCC|nr:YneF family protein [Mycoplasmoides fastidiosum]UUD38138.1 YneF family protein [Mycoplasmoides fastidiosum]